VSTRQPVSPDAPPPREERLDPLVLLRLVRKHWAAAVAVTVAVTLSVAFYTLGQTRIYESTASIQFDPNPPRPLGGKVETIVELGSGAVWDTREYYETQYQIISSMKVALDVVAELGLHRDAAFLQNTPPGATPKGGPAAQGVTEETAAETLRGRLKVDPVKNSRLARVRYQDSDPSRAARVLSAVVDTYVKQNIDDAMNSTTSAADWLHDQLDKLKIDLESSERSLHEYKESKNILSVAFDDKSNMLREEMVQLNTTLTGVRTKREEISARRTELAKVPQDDPSVLPASELLQSSLLQGLRTAFLEAQRARDGLTGAGKGANHPEVQAAQAQVDITRQALLAEIRNIQGALDRDLAVVRRQESGLAGLFEGAKKEALELNLLEIEYNRLRRTKDNNEKLYSMLLERTKETDITRVLRVNNIRVLDRPRIPHSAVKPNVPTNIAAGLALGLLLGVAAAMGLAAADRTIKVYEDVERMGATFLGLIPEIEESTSKKGKRRHRHLQTTGAPELVVHDAPMSGIAEAARSIRTNLMFMAPDKPYRTLLVTSAGPAEGKTTIACCIAIAMAQAGKRVLLVDCDLRRPRLHRIFKVPPDAGLTQALLDGSPEGRVHDSDVPNLAVLVAGPIPPNPAELLQSEKFRTLVERLKRDYDHIILDSSPVVAVTDATILSTLVDATVMVVRAFHTRRDLAHHALRSLADVGATVAGVVLNAVNLQRHEYKYSSHYYYRRDGYYNESGGSSGRSTRPPPEDPGAHAAA
jgi:polysaccharide biosynthesis transport protein